MIRSVHRLAVLPRRLRLLWLRQRQCCLGGSNCSGKQLAVIQMLAQQQVRLGSRVRSTLGCVGNQRPSSLCRLEEQLVVTHQGDSLGADVDGVFTEHLLEGDLTNTPELITDVLHEGQIGSHSVLLNGGPNDTRVRDAGPASKTLSTRKQARPRIPCSRLLDGPLRIQTAAGRVTMKQGDFGRDP